MDCRGGEQFYVSFSFFSFFPNGVQSYGYDIIDHTCNVISSSLCLSAFFFRSFIKSEIHKKWWHLEILHFFSLLHISWFLDQPFIFCRMRFWQKLSTVLKGKTGRRLVKFSLLLTYFYGLLVCLNVWSFFFLLFQLNFSRIELMSSASTGGRRSLILNLLKVLGPRRWHIFSSLLLHTHLAYLTLLFFYKMSKKSWLLTAFIWDGM